MEESSLLSVDLGHVLIREVDVADGVLEQRLLLGLQHLLLMIHLPQRHLFFNLC